MKFKIKITKDVIDKSLLCGTDAKNVEISTNCAFAVAFRELIPVRVWLAETFFIDEDDEIIARVPNSPEQIGFINNFDRLKNKPEERYKLVGQEFDVEIPDAIIEYWYGDAVTATQKIIDSEILKPVYENI